MLTTKGWDVMWPSALDRSLIISRTEVLSEKGTYKRINKEACIFVNNCV